MFYIQYVMEEYETKRKYLRHLKKIAEIRDGSVKPTIFSNVLNLSRSKTKEQAQPSPKCSTIAIDRSEGRFHTSTERIMRDFTVEKENHRLVSKILHMNSSIPLKKYQQDYEESKKYHWKGERTVRKAKYVHFKFFDINFNHGVASSPEDYFTIYVLQDKKKVLLAQDELFQLRKRELKVKKSGEVILKIEGKSQQGLIKLTNSSLLDITKHGNKIGHVVVELCKK